MSEVVFTFSPTDLQRLLSLDEISSNLWIICLLEAKENENSPTLRPLCIGDYRNEVLEKGEFYTDKGRLQNLLKLKTRLNPSKRRVSLGVTRLSDERILLVNSRKNYLKISICNYSSYIGGFPNPQNQRGDPMGSPHVTSMYDPLAFIYKDINKDITHRAPAHVSTSSAKEEKNGTFQIDPASEFSPGWLARIYCDLLSRRRYLGGPSDSLEQITPKIENLIDLGVSPKAIFEDLQRKDRNRDEQFEELKQRLLKQAGINTDSSPKGSKSDAAKQKAQEMRELLQANKHLRSSNGTHKRRSGP